MRVLFMGTPDFAVPSLEATAEAGHEIVAAVSQPDRPKGRGHKMQPTDIKIAAQKIGVPVYQPETLKNNAFLGTLKELSPDIIVVAAYGKILPGYILDYPKYGCVTVHGSLLPKYRGAAPIQRCIINGDKITGVTTMYMDRELDTGDIILKEEVEIGENETAGELFDRLARLGGKLIVKTIEALENGTAPRIKQDDEAATYAPMMEKSTGHIDWTKTSEEIINLIRGVNPWPIAYSEYKGEIMKIFRAAASDGDGAPGEVLGLRDKKIEVACRDGSVLIEELQMRGGKRMSAESYLNGHSIEVGEILK